MSALPASTAGSNLSRDQVPATEYFSPLVVKPVVVKPQYLQSRVHRWTQSMTESEATGVIISLCETWYRTLHLYAARTLRSFTEAQDLTQDVFMDLYAELRSGRDVRNPKAWTIAVLRRKISNHTARRRREGWIFATPEVLDRISAPTTPDPLWNDDLQKLLDLLTDREQEVFLLRLGGLKYREVAQELGLSGSAVNTLLARALRKLQRAADPNLPGGSCAVHNLEEFESDTLQ